MKTFKAARGLLGRPAGWRQRDELTVEDPGEAGQEQEPEPDQSRRCRSARAGWAGRPGQAGRPGVRLPHPLPPQTARPWPRWCFLERRS